MEQAARTIISAPKLLLPLFAVLLGVVMWLAPQLLILGIVGAVLLARHRAKQHRFDTYIAKLLEHDGGE